MLDSFLTAMRQLSILPLGNKSSPSTSRQCDSLALYPLAGLALAVGPGLLLILAILVGFPPALAAALVIAALAVQTGLRHLSDLGRTANAMLSSRPALGSLEVLREKCSGSIGSCGATLILLLKFTALSALLGKNGNFSQAVPAFLLACAAGRWSAVIVACHCPYARPEGGEDEGLISCAGNREIRWALALMLGVFGVCLLLLLLGLQPFTDSFARMVLSITGASATALFAAAWFSRKLGGATRECLGATIEVCETLTLVLMTVGIFGSNS